MILYTPVPKEIIFQPDMAAYEKRKEVIYEGVPMLVEYGENNSCRIVRLLSTDPAHYLDPRFMPGNTIAVDF